MEPAEQARSLYDRDPSATAFGIELVDVDGDGATVRMTVRREMCNGFEIIHGGMVFLLADSAMAFASNTHPNPALATTAEIDWLAPARSGDVLTASATKRWSSNRTALWDVAITNERGEQVALFRGRTRQVPGT